MSNSSSDCFDVLVQSQSNPESQEQSREIFQQKQSFSSFETQNDLVCESCANHSSDSSDSEESSSDTKGSKKSKKIAKTKRTRKLVSSSKWGKSDEIKYWKFYLYNQIRRPYLNMSWAQWKKDQSYIHMAEYVGKTQKQCKSKDQNMKTKNFKIYPGKTIIEIAALKLQELSTTDTKIDREIETLIEQFKALEKRESEHMLMLDIKMGQLEKEKEKIRRFEQMMPDQA